MKSQLPNNYKEVLKQLKDKIAQSQVKAVVSSAVAELKSIDNELDIFPQQVVAENKGRIL